MTTFERTVDMALVREILTEKSCWRRMTDDLAPAIDDFNPEPRADLEYIVARDAGRPVALFLLLHIPQAIEVHFCFLPRVWGSTAAIARAFLAWVWAETAYTWLIGPVPENNRLCLKLAKAAGFEEFCREKGAVRKNGKTYDRILMSITRPNDQITTA